MRKISEKTLKESVFFSRSKSGMPVYVWPKKGLRRKFALLGVRYGSVDSEAALPGAESPGSTPEGVAHFLEHSLFDVRGKDVSEQFSELGASVNAMTTFTDTIYYFSCTENFERAARLLLSFAGRPTFDAARVEREKQIITQEILMSNDSPDWRLFYGLLRSLYKRHPVRIDIAGTVESVGRIDENVLKLCHGAYYRPDNIIFVVAGDVAPSSVLRTVNSVPKPARSAFRGRPERIVPKETAAPFRKSSVERMGVSRANLLLGFKEPSDDSTPEERFRRIVLTGVLLDTILGATSEMYNSLYNRGIIDDTFGISYTAGDDFAYTVMGGDTDKPDILKEAIFEGIAKAKRRGIDAGEFRRKKRKALGGFLRHFNSSEACATALAHFILRRANIFDYLPVLLGLKASDAEERLREHLRRGACASSVIHPLKAKGR